MSVRDITITINRQVQAIEQANFGDVLILATNADVSYGVYTDLASVAQAFAAGTAAHSMSAALFAQGIPRVAILGVSYTSGTDPVTALTTALTTLQQSQDGWYFLLCDQQGDDEITELSNNFISAQQKMYFADTTNIGLVATLNNDRTVVIYKDDITDYPAAAWVGVGAQNQPGTASWKFNVLNGVAFDSTITEAQIQTLHGDGGNAYIRALGTNYTSNGIAADGSFIDIVRASDYLQSRIVEAIFGLQIRSKKVPFTQDGINQVGAEISGVLQGAVTDGIIAVDAGGNGEFTLSLPAITDIAANDKAAGLLQGITADIVLSGAVLEIRATLNIVLEL